MSMSVGRWAGEQDAEQDRHLVARAQEGDREALEALIERYQPGIYNIAVRMLYHPEDAEDATQEILIKVMTKLSTFEGRSRFGTWLYRIATNHVLNMKRGRLELPTLTFSEFGRSLDEATDQDLPDPGTVPVDVKLLVDEARIGCTSGMLLCLDREQRLVYVLGTIMGEPDVVGAELLEISRDAFRQRLASARRDLHQFMHEKCGLVNTSNPCRCARKTRAFMKAGWVNPDDLLFARAHVRRVREVAEQRAQELGELDRAYAELYRHHPFHESRRAIVEIRRLVRSGRFQELLDAPR